MLPNFFNNTTIPALQEAIGFAQARHEVLVGNVANIDTPGYRTRDLSVEAFQDNLKEAIEQRDRARVPISRDLSASQPGDPIRKVRESLNSILYHDESNVSIEHQVAEISKNQYYHNLSIAILNGQFRLLQTAISERI